MAKRLVVYMRKSEEDKDKQKNSIERQAEDIEKYLNRHNKTYADEPAEQLTWKKEEGVDWFWEEHSAKTSGRPVFGKMIEHIHKYKFDVLLCTELSRLARNPVDAGTIANLLDSHKDKKITKTYIQEIRTLDKTFTTIPTDKFTLLLFLSISKYENDMRGQNTSSGMGHIVSKGGTPNLARLGYINVGTQKGNKWVEEDGENFTICRELWDMLLEDNYERKEIYKHALDRDLTTYRGKGKRSVPSYTTVFNMFTSKYYTGKVEKKDKDKSGVTTSKWIKGNHPAMITEEEFQNAQIILARSGYKHSKIDKAMDIGVLIKELGKSAIHKNDNGEPCSIIYEKRGRYTCTQCPNRFYDNNSICKQCNTPVSKDTQKSYLKSFKHFLKDASSKKQQDSITYGVVIKQLKEQLSQLYISDEVFEVLKRKLYTEWEKQNEGYVQKRKYLRKKLEELEEEEIEVNRAMFQDEKKNQKNTPVNQKVLNKIETEKQKIEDELIMLKCDFEDIFERAWETLIILKEAKNILAPGIESDFEPKKQLLISLTSNLIFYKKRVEIKWRKPFDLLVKSNVSNYKKGDKNKIYLHNFSSGSPD